MDIPNNTNLHKYIYWTVQ